MSHTWRVSTEKLAYLEEQLSYELVMLNYTFMRLMTSASSTPEEQLDFNAFLESFAVHARNLVEFLSNEAQQGGRRAWDYIPTFEAPNQAVYFRRLLGLENQILRTSAQRPTGPQGGFASRTHVNFTAGSCRRSSSFRGSFHLYTEEPQCPR